MMMEGQVKFFNPKNTAGVSKAVAVISQTVEVNGDKVSNIKMKIIKP